MYNNRLVICVLFYFFFLMSLQKCDRSGSYTLHVDSLEECPDLPGNESDVKWFARYFRYNRTANAVNFTVDVPFPVDKKISGRLHVLKWSDGGWRNNFFRFEQNDICNVAITFYRKLAVHVYKSMGIKNPRLCPVDPGTYSAYNFYAPVDLVDVPFFYGKFKVILDGFRSKKRIGCISGTVTLTEKSH